MNKVLEEAIDKIRALPEERQLYAAELLEWVASSTQEFYELSEEEERLIQEGLAELDQGLEASDEDVRTIFDKFTK